MEAEEGTPSRKNDLSKGREVESSGCVQGRMSVQILVSKSTAQALFVSSEPKPSSLQ